MILAIVGASGSGKDTIADWFCDHEGFQRIVSYTTRPMREGETQGKEHYFVTQFPDMDKDHFAAYTFYGNHHYWVNKQQLESPYPIVYVVDENGLQQLRQSLTPTTPTSDSSESASPHTTVPDASPSGSKRPPLISIYVERDESLRRKSGVSEERILRDRSRHTLPLDSYDFIIKNNKSLKALDYKLRDLTQFLHTRAAFQRLAPSNHRPPLTIHY